MAIVAPIIVLEDPGSWPGPVVRAGHRDVSLFYRRPADARAALSPTSLVFDAGRRRLAVVDDELPVAYTDPDGAEQLCEPLPQLAGMDAIRGSIAGMPIAALVECSVQHASDCGLYR